MEDVSSRNKLRQRDKSPLAETKLDRGIELGISKTARNATTPAFDEVLASKRGIRSAFAWPLLLTAGDPSQLSNTTK
jgi:hypothetical protein